MMATSMEKNCKRCGIAKPLSSEFFHAAPRHKDGFGSWCKICIRERERELKGQKARVYSVVENGTKLCMRCEIKLPVENFHQEIGATGNKRSWCKSCVAEYDREYRSKTKDKRKLQKQDYQIENREKLAAYHHDYYLTNRPKFQEKSKQHYLSDRNQYILRSKKRYQTLKNTPEFKIVRRAADSRRRVRIANAGKGFTAQDIMTQLDMQQGICWWCNKPLDPSNYHIEHRIPLARGGSNNADNICIACPKCNLSKGAKMPWEWIGRLL